MAREICTKKGTAFRKSAVPHVPKEIFRGSSRIIHPRLFFRGQLTGNLRYIVDDR